MARNVRPVPAGLAQAAAQFAAWRRRRTERQIPPRLWRLATEMARRVTAAGPAGRSASAARGACRSLARKGMCAGVSARNGSGRPAAGGRLRGARRRPGGPTARDPRPPGQGVRQAPTWLHAGGDAAERAGGWRRGAPGGMMVPVAPRPGPLLAALPPVTRAAERGRPGTHAANDTAVKDGETTLATYRYDALGRRVEKAVNGGVTTRYLLDGVQVVEEYDGSDAWQARYVYEDGIDQPRSMDRADIADVDGDQNTTEVLRFHYHQQALGCVTEMSEPGGAVVEWVTYDAYGLPTIRDMQGNQVSQSAIGNPYLYTGREYDPESGLYFYRARHYDPGTGRFLQRDPSGYVDGGSLYVYTRSRSPCARDPRGLESEEVERARAEYDEAAAEVGRLEDERDHLKAEDDEAIDRYLELVRESVLSPEPANADPDLPSMKDQIAGAADDMQKVLDENATRQAELLDEIDAAKRRRALALNALMRAKGLEESAAQAGAQLRAPAQPPSPYPDGIPVEIWLRKDGRWHLLVAGVRSGGVFEIYVGPCPPGFTGFPGPEPRKGPWEPEPETPWPPDFAKPSAPSGPERWR